MVVEDLVVAFKWPGIGWGVVMQREDLPQNELVDLLDQGLEHSYLG